MPSPQLMSSHGYGIQGLEPVGPEPPVPRTTPREHTVVAPAFAHSAVGDVAPRTKPPEHTVVSPASAHSPEGAAMRDGATMGDGANMTWTATAPAASAGITSKPLACTVVPFS